MLRVGVVAQPNLNWAAASSYVRMLTLSLGRACHEAGNELYVLARDEDFDRAAAEVSARPVRLSSAEYLPGERFVRRALRRPDKTAPLRGELRLRHRLNLRDRSDIFQVARAHGIQVLLPLLDLPAWNLPEVQTIGWIPDFQHLYLPEYSPADERARRNESIRRLAEHSTFVMLSSHAAWEDFRQFAPAFAHKARVHSFPSLFAFSALTGDASASRQRYHLPEKFALVANQFWAHKNHEVVIAALARLKQQGRAIPVVMTGLPADFRDPTNKNLSRLLQAIASADLSGHVTVLGQVPYEDLIGLMRAAALVIQPSRFEGWNTTVQDAKALGRPMLCSDLPVHREQAPDALGFFPCDDPEALASLIATEWSGLEPGPNPEREAKALLAEQAFAHQHGQSLLRTCLEASGKV